MFITDRLGRKPTLLISSVGVLVSLLALGTFFYFDDNVEVLCPETSLNTSTTAEPCQPKSGFSTETVDGLSWMPLTSLFTFKFFHVLGLSPLPTMLNGEFFSSEAKDVSTMINMTFTNICGFVVSRYQVRLF